MQRTVCLNPWQRGYNLLMRALALFPYQVAYLYTTDVVKQGLISTSIGAGLVAGQVLGSVIAVPGGNLRYKQIFYMSGLCAFTAGLAGSTESEAVGTAMAIFAGFFIGLLEVTVSTSVLIVLDDQSEIGTAGGVFGSLRAAFGVLGSKSSSYKFLLVMDANIRTSSCDLQYHFPEQIEKLCCIWCRSRPPPRRPSTNLDRAFPRSCCYWRSVGIP